VRLLRRWFRRTIRPTREGWWCASAALGLGLAALNTGNNLVYLLCSLLLALILVSGILSEHTLWGLRVRPMLPGEAYAGTPALVGALVANRKRRSPSLSLTLEVPAAGGGVRFLHLPRLEAGEERLVTWTTTFPARGRHRLAGVRLATRFPFGLFTKSETVALDAELLVYPAVGPVSGRRFRDAGDTGPVPRRRRGRGDDLYDLRPYRPGDDPRLIHWRSSARAQLLTVRELEDEATHDVRIVLTGDGRREIARREAAVSEAASLAVHLLRRGAGVELAGPGLAISLGRGRGQEVRVLTALALFEPGASAAAPPGAGVSLREVRIPID
jgi:uncharacterized protein (DUF58 family)